MNDYEKKQVRDEEHNEGGGSFSMESLHQLIRAAGGVLGIITIIIGLVYASRMFALILGGLGDPEGFQINLEKWNTAVGGDELSVMIAGEVYHCAQPVAILILGLGAIALAWIAIGFIRTGAKIISLTVPVLGDREAVKKILIHAFGPAKKPAQNNVPASKPLPVKNPDRKF